MSDCLFPEYAPSTGYRRGCRCERCRWSERDRYVRTHDSKRIPVNRVVRCERCGWGFTAKFTDQSRCSWLCKYGTTPGDSVRLAIQLCRTCATLTCFPASKVAVRGGNCVECRLVADRERSAAGSRRRRARLRSLPVERYTLAEIGSRDGWRCHLCGTAVNRRLPGSDPKGPSIDHLVPVAAGGGDVRHNVALAHTGCNVRRNARGVAQLRLAV